MNNVPVISKFVKFINIQDYVINFDNPTRITVEFFVDQKVKVTSKDWIAIFPEGCDFWNSVDFDLIVTYEFILNRPVSNEEKLYKIPISLKGAKNLICGQEYQFVYYNSISEVLGVSDLFKFLEPLPREIRPKPAANVMLYNNNNEEEYMVEDEPFKGNRRGRSHWKLQGPLIVKDELPVTVFEDSGKDEVDVVEQRGRNGNRSRKNKQGFINKVHQMAINTVGSDSQLVPRRLALTTSCSNCQRVGSLLKTQAELYRQIKNLAEKNSDLEKEVSCLKKQIELAQAAYQKLSVTLMHERELKLFFQAAASDRIDYQVMMVENAPPASHQEKHRLEDKTRLTSNLKLKAIIGNQEETIRTLTEKLAQLEALQVQKVTAVVKDLETGTVNCVSQELNNVGGKAVENHL